ncbi:O-succinylbenzoic acid--CoA ligase [Haloferax mucosum ATCC BAA-1512]|uniref:2-succinylbenzoate--CoA ligase n=1 Tax=Haloferax mucosum ATCC BAA-1512 TaxID=662479 RepID=M0I5E3_9EURY|nr:O-succinylbenzoic acid--CoA ligase [Haloferax mucosum ATCC BAA-1512]
MTDDTADDAGPNAARHGFAGPMRDWLSHRVAATPEREALIHAPTGDSWTFRELDALVTETAGQLAALGVEAGDHLGVVLDPGIDYVRLIHAATRLGAVLVPLSERLTPNEINRNIELADVTTLVCGEPTESTAVEATTDVPVVSVDEPRWEGVINLSAIAPKRISPAGWRLSETMLLLFTSGTTGTPKAVRLTMGNLLANAVAGSFRLGLSPDDRWLVTLSLHHMGGIGPIFRSPLYGTTVVLREGFDAGGAADDIGKYDVTGVSVVPTMLTRMLDSRGTLSDSLRVVLLGGAPASDELIERCRNYSVPVYPTYGMTETASQVATATPREAFSAVGTVGRPLYFTDLSVVDEGGFIVEPGTPGEIVVSGPTVSPGYYQNPDATAETFTSEGLRTGDIGYKDEDGLVYVLNRKDDRIITGGENVDPGEVVEVLRQYSAVDDAVVLGLPDSEWGERVSALLTLSDPDTSLDRDALDAFCRDRLAGFKVPRLVETTAELPRTVSGTIDREAAREQLEDARPVAEAEPEWSEDDADEASSDVADADSLVVDDAERATADDETDDAELVDDGDSDATDASDTDGDLDVGAGDDRESESEAAGEASADGASAGDESERIVGSGDEADDAVDEQTVDVVADEQTEDGVADGQTVDVVSDEQTVDVVSDGQTDTPESDTSTDTESAASDEAEDAETDASEDAADAEDTTTDDSGDRESEAVDSDERPDSPDEDNANGSVNGESGDETTTEAATSDGDSDARPDATNHTGSDGDE